MRARERPPARGNSMPLDPAIHTPPTAPQPNGSAPWASCPDDEFRTPVGERWTVAITLVHLAFSTTLAARAPAQRGGGPPGPDRPRHRPQRPVAADLGGRTAARRSHSLEAATAIDEFVATLESRSPTSCWRATSAGVRRSLHRARSCSTRPTRPCPPDRGTSNSTAPPWPACSPAVSAARRPTASARSSRSARRPEEMRRTLAGRAVGAAPGRGAAALVLGAIVEMADRLGGVAAHRVTPWRSAPSARRYRTRPRVARGGLTMEMATPAVAQTRGRHRFPTQRGAGGANHAPPGRLPSEQRGDELRRAPCAIRSPRASSQPGGRSCSAMARRSPSQAATPRTAGSGRHRGRALQPMATCRCCSKWFSSGKYRNGRRPPRAPSSS